MTGETDLRRLIAGMEPKADPTPYLFCRLPQGRALTADLVDAALLIFREDEAITLILPQTLASPDLAPLFPCRRITLTIHSDLQAVGFLAAITTRLAQLGMGVNPVSAYYHDHLFIPADRADEVITALKEMALAAGQTP